MKILVLCFLFAILTVTTFAQSKSIQIAIFREGGIIIPFAEYINQTWTISLPEANINTEIKSISDLPLPWFEKNGSYSTSWYYQPAIGASKIFEVTNKPTKIKNHGNENWGFIIPHENSVAPSYEHHKNIGITSNEKSDIYSMLDLKTDTKTRKRLLPLIVSAFNKNEAKQIIALDHQNKENKKSGNIEFKKFTPIYMQRKLIPITITKLSRSRTILNGFHIYYIEARREYNKRKTDHDPSCPVVSIFNSWVIQDKDGVFNMLDESSIITDCDGKEGGKEGASVTPLGTIKIDNRAFIVTEEHGYEDEGYVILEFKNRKIKQLLTVAGGGL